MTGFAVMVFLLTVCGILVCHADFKSSLLYAALTTEIMLLCYGIVKSLIGLLYAWMPDLYYDMAGIAAMLASEALSLLLTGVCYYMVYRYGKGAFKKGTGLSNVKKVAEKYGGAMSIETREDVFILQVLLIIPQHPESISQQMD